MHPAKRSELTGQEVWNTSKIIINLIDHHSVFIYARSHGKIPLRLLVMLNPGDEAIFINIPLQVSSYNTGSLHSQGSVIRFLFWVAMTLEGSPGRISYSPIF